MTENNNKGYVTANDLQKWIDHLTDKEKELPIVVSTKMFPSPSEMILPEHIGHWVTGSFDGFVIVCSKYYSPLFEEKEDLE